MYVAQKQRKTWLYDTNKDEMKAFVGALYFMALHRLPKILIITFLLIGYLLFLHYKMFLPGTDSGNCGRIFIWLTTQGSLLLLMTATISFTNYVP